MDFADIQTGLDDLVRRGIADPDRMVQTGWRWIHDGVDVNPDPPLQSGGRRCGPDGVVFDVFHQRSAAGPRWLLWRYAVEQPSNRIGGPRP